MEGTSVLKPCKILLIARLVGVSEWIRYRKHAYNGNIGIEAHKQKPSICTSLPPTISTQTNHILVQLCPAVYWPGFSQFPRTLWAIYSHMHGHKLVCPVTLRTPKNKVKFCCGSLRSLVKPTSWKVSGPKAGCWTIKAKGYRWKSRRLLEAALRRQYMLLVLWKVLLTWKGLQERMLLSIPSHRLDQLALVLVLLGNPIKTRNQQP